MAHQERRSWHQVGLRSAGLYWRGVAAALLMLLFVWVWHHGNSFLCTAFVLPPIQIGGRSGSVFLASILWWTVVFSLACALISASGRRRIVWAVGAGAVFWIAELLREGLAIGREGYMAFWPTGWVAVRWAIWTAALTYALSPLVGPRPPTRTEQTPAQPPEAPFQPLC